MGDGENRHGSRENKKTASVLQELCDGVYGVNDVRANPKSTVQIKPTTPIHDTPYQVRMRP